MRVSLLDVLVAFAIALGIVGIVVPILPGTLLVAAALLVWAVQTGGTTAWLFTLAGLSLLVVGAVVKYALPARQLKRTGVPQGSLAVGALLGIVGFFVVPVIGIVLGFVLGIYLAEARRVGAAPARGTTWAAMRAVGLSLLIEFTAAVLAAFTWAIAVVVI